MRRHYLLLFMLLSFNLGLAGGLTAAPAHIIRFFAPGQQVGCLATGWGSMITLYNATERPATVRVMGISNGAPFRVDPDRVEVPAGAVVWMDEMLQGAWIPQSGSVNAKLWMMHLDVPEGIFIESRDEIFLSQTSSPCVISPIPLESLGKASLPVFRDAVPANKTQVHLGTDVGTKDARINVGIYNAAAVIANAHIEVRRSCDGSVTDSRDVQIPADTILQFANFVKGPDHCVPNTTTPTAMTPSWLRYTVITVDQPSMTYALAISETRNPVPGLAPEIGLAVPTSVQY